MKTLRNFKLLAAVGLLIFASCETEEPFEESFEDSKKESALAKSSSFTAGPICDDKPILKYHSLYSVQQAHKNLYSDYTASNEDEQVLIDWENAIDFYSLRQKDYEMDEGIIPDDPLFDSWQYTSDEVLESMLNEDGMIIIGGYLYLWDDGCVIHRIRYTDCDSYTALLKFGMLVNSYTGSPAEEELLFIFRNEMGVEDVDICSDARFDFETLSEEDFRINNKQEPEPNLKSGPACGYEAHIQQDILGHDPVNQIISIKFEANSIAPVGDDPLYSFYIDNSSEFQSIEITNASIPTAIGINWELAGGAGFVYPGKWFVVEIDYSNTSTFVPFLAVSLFGVINGVSGDSCSDWDFLSIPLDCPVSISKQPINAASGDWNFTVEGLEALTGNFNIIWNFGDGSPSQTVSNNTSVFHTFPIPCMATTFNVTAIIESQEVCDNRAQSTSFSSWDTCKRQTINEKWKEKFDGKNAKLKIKIKERAQILGGGTKIKHKFRYRKNGEKTISSNGNLYLASGLNCIPTSLSSLLPAESQSGKKRLKQKYTNLDNYLVDLNAPASVTFTHSNGYNKTLTYTGTCSQ